MFVSVRNEVSQTTIVNCFKKAKKSKRGQTIPVKDKDDPFKEFNDDLKELREKDLSLVPEEMTAEDFASADNAVITTSLLTDEEILEEASPNDNDKDTEDDKGLVATSKRDVENS